MTKPPNDPERDLKDAYDAAAAECRSYLATAHPLASPNVKK